mmetsp:Transcript_62469/g.161251  ORF Transcript_62469/g.161251 Transcript_62469/m.161251 type:complete len:237 (-) Transcript_62469:249-959(-)
MSKGGFRPKSRRRRAKALSNMSCPPCMSTTSNGVLPHPVGYTCTRLRTSTRGQEFAKPHPTMRLTSRWANGKYKEQSTAESYKNDVKRRGSIRTARKAEWRSTTHCVAARRTSVSIASSLRRTHAPIGVCWPGDHQNAYLLDASAPESEPKLDSPSLPPRRFLSWTAADSSNSTMPKSSRGVAAPWSCKPVSPTPRLAWIRLANKLSRKLSMPDKLMSIVTGCKDGSTCSMRQNNF